MMADGVEGGERPEGVPGRERRFAGLGAIVAVTGGAWLVAGGARGNLTAGILLLVAGLALAGVALGAGSDERGGAGGLDLSTRIGLGVLGGLLAGLAHGLLTRLAGASGLTEALGVNVATYLSGAQWVSRATLGAALGLGFGLAYPWIPGRSPAARAGVFSLLPGLYVLLIAYPIGQQLGFLGLALGRFTFVLVLVANFLASLVAAGVLGWAERTEETPSRALCE